MKILLLTQWFEPETCLKGLSFARELQRLGHDVSVLTGFPNYPGGRLYPGYRVRPWQREIMDGISVVRVPLYPSHDRSAPGRVLNYGSFAFAAAAATLALPRPDIVYVYSPPPTAALGALLLRALRGVPFILDVQDMWPDTLGATGMVRQGGLIRAVEWWLARIYKRAARITVLSDGFRRLLIERGVAADRITVIPNWTDECAPLCPSPSSQAAQDYFDIVYAGNLGPGQAVDVVIGAARLLRGTAPHIRFLIAGDGVDAANLAASASADALDNVVFLGRLPGTQMPELFARAEALLVHLRDEPVFHVTIPSKTQAYLRAGKPILMGVRGDAADLIRKAGAGLAFEPGNPAALAEVALEMAALAPAQRQAMGDAGADYYRLHLSLKVGAGTFSRLFEEVVAADES